MFTHSTMFTFCPELLPRAPSSDPVLNFCLEHRSHYLWNRPWEPHLSIVSGIYSGIISFPSCQVSPLRAHLSIVSVICTQSLSSHSVQNIIQSIFTSCEEFNLRSIWHCIMNLHSLTLFVIMFMRYWFFVPFGVTFWRKSNVNTAKWIYTGAERIGVNSCRKHLR